MTVGEPTNFQKNTSDPPHAQQRRDSERCVACTAPPSRGPLFDHFRVKARLSAVYGWPSVYGAVDVCKKKTSERWRPANHG